ncbi:MAG TPA: glycerophosphoryl diester phosphodiesterase membrane domain-containing protein, partial [Actinomycetota bacterium]|nr:glycerophosphoryl diester phosphodiesterase membrane domain-containing protein [Actinomycetota bacterium]
AVGTVVGFLLLIIPGVIAAIRFTFGTTVVVIEGARGTKALRRSWRLAKGSFWRILGTLLLAAILAAVVTGIVTIPTTLIANGTGSPFTVEDASGWPIRAVGSTIASVIVTPFTALVRVLLYFDMRIRKEGFDIAVMAHDLATPE